MELANLLNFKVSGFSYRSMRAKEGGRGVAQQAHTCTLSCTHTLHSNTVCRGTGSFKQEHAYKHLQS